LRGFYFLWIGKMAMTVTITTEDPHSAVCVQLIADLSAELGARYGDDGTGLFKPDDASDPRAAFVVAWLDGEAVGCGAIRPMRDDTVAEVKRMYVRESARGKGISRRILASLESLAAEFDYRAVQLETGLYQQEATRLYESSGYARIPCYPPYEDNPLSLCYEKRLIG
jgi:GNAT superfamily N-acetyltransferase